MIRYCAECPGCKLLETVQGNLIYVCMDEEGGAFLQETGLCGFCGESDAPDCDKNINIEE